MSRVFQPALGMGKPTGRFEVEDFAVPARWGELVHLDRSPEEELEDESEETTASLVGEKVVSGNDKGLNASS